MGREIVYCFKCAKRIDGSAFEKREAYRYGDKVSCDECVLELVADLPAEEQEAILNADPVPKGSTGRVPKAEPPPPPATTKRRTGPIPTIKTGGTTRATAVRKAETGRIPTSGTQRTRAITRSIPKAAPPPSESEEGEEGGNDEAAARKKKLILIGAGGGGLLLVAVVVAAILLMGGKKTPVNPADTGSAPAPVGPRLDPRKAREEAAKKAYDGAMAVFRDKAGDLGAQLAALEGAKGDVDGTALAEELARQLEIVETKMNGELSKLDGEATPLLQESRFKAAMGVYEAASTRYDHAKWKDGTAKKLASISGIIEDRFLGLKKSALQAKENGEQAKVDEAIAKVAAFEMPELVERLKKDLGAAAAAPEAAAPDTGTPAPSAKGKKKRELKPLPTDLKNYWPGFQRAMGLVSLRDFEAAAVELRRAAKDADSDGAKEALAKDLEVVEQAKALVEGAGKTLGRMKRLDPVALEIQDRPGEFKVVEGRVLSANDQRAEVRTVVEKDGKKSVKPQFVEWLSLSGKSLADQLKKLGGKAPSKEEALALAVLCLSEGNDDAAEAMAGGEAGRIADRFWAHAPEAKEKAPKSSREFEARALFHAAENDWKTPATRGGALEKYKQLQNEFAGTLISRNNSAAISARASMGKEYSFHAFNLDKSGSFKTAKKPEPTLQSTKDAEDLRELQENFVEAPFYALPGLTYRCWALVGGCCKETFTFYYQTTGGTTTIGGKTAEIDPGGNMAAPVPIQLTRLAKDHAAHKPKDPKAAHPKDAVRWEWIPIPFPKTYAEHGPKAVRIMSDQMGFAVKFIVVTSVRTQTPNPMDTSAYLQEIAAAASAPADEGVAGDPEPKQWYVCGPFNEPLNTKQAPEGEIDLAKEMTGKNNLKFKWKLANAEVRGERAKFDLEKNRLFNPKDNVSAYALIHVKAPEALAAQVQIGHDDGGRVWLNGQLVHSKDQSDFKDDAFKASVQLEGGWNRLLVKVRNGNAGFGFVIRIVDGSGKPIEGLQYSAYGDELFPP